MNEAFRIHAPSAPLRQSPGIVNSARSRFAHFGYAKTSMREIADDCSMSPANLYRFYPGKLAIATAVVEDGRNALFRACDDAIAAALPNPVARLSALFLTLIDQTRRQIVEEPLLFELGLIVSREAPASRLSLLEQSRTRILSTLSEARPLSADLDRAATLVHLASAPFVLPWMLANQPFGDVRPQVPEFVAGLFGGLSSIHTGAPS